MNAHFTDQDLLTFVRAMASMAASDGRVSLEEREQLEAMGYNFLSPVRTTLFRFTTKYLIG
jgi:hypothetical protein